MRSETRFNNNSISCSQEAHSRCPYRARWKRLFCVCFSACIELCRDRKKKESSTRAQQAGGIPRTPCWSLAWSIDLNAEQIDLHSNGDTYDILPSFRRQTRQLESTWEWVALPRFLRWLSLEKFCLWWRVAKKCLFVVYFYAPLPPPLAHRFFTSLLVSLTLFLFVYWLANDHVGAATSLQQLIDAKWLKLVRWNWSEPAGEKRENSHALLTRRGDSLRFLLI